jgi:hypothetical protein
MNLQPTFKMRRNIKNGGSVVSVKDLEALNGPFTDLKRHKGYWTCTDATGQGRVFNAVTWYITAEIKPPPA